MRRASRPLLAGALAGALAGPLPWGGWGTASAGCIYPIPTSDGGARAQVSHAIAEISRALSVAARIQTGLERLNSATGLESLLALGAVALPAPDGIPGTGPIIADPGGGLPWQAVASGISPAPGFTEALRAAGLPMDGSSVSLPGAAPLARSLGIVAGQPGVKGTPDEIRLLTGIPGGDARHRLGTLADLLNPALRESAGAGLPRLSGLGSIDLSAVSQGGAWRIDSIPLDAVRDGLAGTPAGEALEEIRRQTRAGLWDVKGYIRRVESPGSHLGFRDRILADGADGLLRHPMVRESPLAEEAVRQLGRMANGHTPYANVGLILRGAGLDPETARLLGSAAEAARSGGTGGTLTADAVAAAAEAAAARLPVGIPGRVAAACFQAEGCPDGSAASRGTFGAPSPTWLGREARRRAMLDAALSRAGVAEHLPGSLARGWLDGVGEELSRQHSCATGDSGHRSEPSLDGRAAPAASGGGEAPTDALYLDASVGRSGTLRVLRARRDHLLSTALDAWATARSERGHTVRLEARQRVLADRLEACGDIACEMRVAADAARIRAEAMRRRAELEAERLRMAQALAVHRQPLHRTGIEGR